MDKNLPTLGLVKNNPFFAKHPLVVKLILVLFLLILLGVVVGFAPLQIYRSGFLFSSVSPKLGFLDNRLDSRFVPQTSEFALLPDGTNAFVMKGTFEALDEDEKGAGVLQIKNSLGETMKFSFSSYTTRLYWTNKSLSSFSDRFAKSMKVLNDSYYPDTTMIINGPSYLKKGDAMAIYIDLGDEGVDTTKIRLGRSYLENVQKTKVSVIVAEAQK
jgi:hypothetical protein